MAKKIDIDKDITLVTEKSDSPELSKEEQQARDAHYKALVKEWGGIYMSEGDVTKKLWNYTKMPPSAFRHDRFIAQGVMALAYGMTKRLMDDIQKKADPADGMKIKYEDLPKHKPYAIMYAKGLTQIIKNHVKHEVAVEQGKLTLDGCIKKITKLIKLK